MGVVWSSYWSSSEIQPSPRTLENRKWLLKEVVARDVVLNHVEQPKPLFETVIFPKSYEIKNSPVTNNKKKKKKK